MSTLRVASRSPTPFSKTKEVLLGPVHDIWESGATVSDRFVFFCWGGVVGPGSELDNDIFTCFRTAAVLDGTAPLGPSLVSLNSSLAWFRNGERDEPGYPWPSWLKPLCTRVPLRPRTSRQISFVHGSRAWLREVRVRYKVPRRRATR